MLRLPAFIASDAVKFYAWSSAPEELVRRLSLEYRLRGLSPTERAHLREMPAEVSRPLKHRNRYPARTQSCPKASGPSSCLPMQCTTLVVAAMLKLAFRISPLCLIPPLAAAK